MNTLLMALPWIQIGLSAILITLVLLQQSEAGLGSAFGNSGGESFRRTKRGAEKGIFIATIIVGILFAVSAAVALFIA